VLVLNANASASAARSDEQRDRWLARGLALNLALVFEDTGACAVSDEGARGAFT